MRRLTLIFFTCTLLACGKTNDAFAPFHAIDISWQHPQASFHLRDFNGRVRNLNDFSDKITVVFFGYTHCPEVCPTTLADLSQVMRLLGTDASQVQVLFITLDPERDTPALLAQFVPAFNTSFLGLYGDTVSTAQAAQSFGVNYSKHPDAHGGYSVDHSDGMYILGKQGKPLLLAPYGQPAEQVLADIRLLLH